MDVITRFIQMQEQRPELRLYVLIDGLAYQEHAGHRLARMPGISRALFDGTPDAPLAHAGPWLFHAEQIEDQLPALFAFEAAQAAISWLITGMDLEGLAQVLQLRQDVQLATGQSALLRLSDPRVLNNLFTVMNPEQKTHFFDLIEEWHFLRHGQRVWSGRNHA